MGYKIYTIGHSTHSTDEFISLLNVHKITAIGDVRSSPYSKFNPQFNREIIKEELKKYNIEYVYLGKELGPRSDDPKCYKNGKAIYKLIADSDLFKKGLQRLKGGIGKYKIALMCAEKDPITCHRMILICRQIKTEDIKIYHILENGEIETNDDAQKRLMKAMKIPEATLFDKPEALISQAYDIQSEKIAFVLSDKEQD
jgi:uncharacterized protein (DUF488 family)